MKHNKKRNTAFIYEALTRQLTKTILSKDASRRSAIINVLKEFFSVGSPLHEELQIYKTLLETENIQKEIAEKLVTESKSAYSRLDENTIFNAQSQLIASINKTLGQDVWGTFVPNFKSLASINAIFNNKVGIKKRVLFEQATVDRMSAPLTESTAEDLKPLDSLTYASFINKFNDKYENILTEQKELLNRYITSFADDGLELKLYLNEELSRLKESLTSLTPETTDTLLCEKATAVSHYLEGFRHREFSDDDLSKVLKTQQLVRELETND